MTTRRRQRRALGWAMCIAAAMAGCAAPGPRASDSATAPNSEPTMQPAAPSPGEAQPAKAGAAGNPTLDPAPARAAGEKPRYHIQYRFEPGDVSYYIIENEFVDHGGVPSFGLTFTSTVRDRTSLVQRVISGAPPRENTGSRMFAGIEWEIDRYEVHEKAMKDDHRFDSLRELYPKAQLRGLAGTPGARVAFSMEPVSGQTMAWRITPGQGSGPRTVRKLSRTAERCILNDTNLRRLLDDLGPLFLPGQPKAVGESWTATRSHEMRNAGTAVIDYTFTLRDVRETDGTRIAVIDVTGTARLNKAAPPRPQPNAKKPPADRDFRIDRATHQGQIEFDVDRGRLAKMELRRELDLSAEVKGKDELMTMDLVTGEAHRLLVLTGTTPPPRPVVVGERKPPVEDPEPPPKRPATRTPTSRPATATTQPAGAVGESTSTRFPASRPAAHAGRSTTSQPGPGVRRVPAISPAKSAPATRADRLREAQGKGNQKTPRGATRPRPASPPASQPAADD